MTKFAENADQFVLEPSQSLSSQIAERICQRIQNEKLVPGTHLGTVDKLTEQFGVSRTVIREAIGSLRGLGVITGRPKIGLSVAKGDVQSVLRKVLIPRTTHDQGWCELAKFRVVIEIGSVPLIVENIKPEQVDRLNMLISDQWEILKNQQNDPAKVFQEFVHTDLLFHETLLEAADQDLITQFHQVLAKYFQQGVEYFPFPTQRMVEDHEEIVKAIIDNNTSSAVRHMHTHLQPILDSIKKNKESRDI